MQKVPEQNVGGRAGAHLEEVFELIEVEINAWLVVARPDGALLRRADLVPVQLLQPPPLLRTRLHLRTNTAHFDCTCLTPASYFWAPQLMVSESSAVPRRLAHLLEDGAPACHQWCLGSGGLEMTSIIEIHAPSFPYTLLQDAT